MVAGFLSHLHGADGSGLRHGWTADMIMAVLVVPCWEAATALSTIIITTYIATAIQKATATREESFRSPMISPTPSFTVARL